MSNSREILVAVLVGIVIISGSVYVNASSTTIEGEVSVVPPPPERKYIPPTDSDGDGISDWAEELLADREIISQELDPSDVYLPPTTLTGKFSVGFFQQYLTAKGFGTFSENKDELVKQATANLQREATDRIYTFSDIIFAPTDTIESIRAYGNTVATIVLEHSEEVTENEVDILQRAMKQNDPSRLSQIDPAIASYENFLAMTLATPVPFSLRQEHVDLINVYNAILSDLKAMRGTFEDPLLGLLRLKRYNQDIEGLVYTYYNLDRALRRAGVLYQEDEPGTVFNALGIVKEILSQ